MAARMAGVGLVTVSLRRSIIATGAERMSAIFSEDSGLGETWFSFLQQQVGEAWRLGDGRLRQEPPKDLVREQTSLRGERDAIAVRRK